MFLHFKKTLLLSLISVGLTSSSQVIANDQPSVLTLTADERDHVKNEMRGFLESVQAILDGISRDDMKAVSAAASQSGFAGQGGAPATLRAKLPMAFKQLGMGTHKAFDQLAMDAEAMEDGEQVIKQLGKLMENCVACHRSFRIKQQND